MIPSVTTHPVTGHLARSGWVWALGAAYWPIRWSTLPSANVAAMLVVIGLSWLLDGSSERLCDGEVPGIVGMDVVGAYKRDPGGVCGVEDR